MVAGGGAATVIVGAGSGATGHDQDLQHLRPPWSMSMLQVHAVQFSLLQKVVDYHLVLAQNGEMQ